MVDHNGTEIEPGDIIAYNFHSLPTRLLRVVKTGPRHFLARDARPAYPLYDRVIRSGSSHKTVVMRKAPVSDAEVREIRIQRRPRPRKPYVMTPERKAAFARVRAATKQRHAEEAAVRHQRMLDQVARAKERHNKEQP